MASVKALVRLISPCMHYLSTNKTLIKKQSAKKLAKFKMLFFFVKTYFYGIKLIHANVQCIYTVYAKYQMASVKALVRADVKTDRWTHGTDNMNQYTPPQTQFAGVIKTQYPNICAGADKTNKMTCVPSKDRSAWPSIQSNQSLC